MYTETLVDREIVEGRELVEALQRAGIQAKASLWYFATEMNDWRLMIQLPLTNEYRHQVAYEQIEKFAEVSARSFAFR